MKRRVWSYLLERRGRHRIHFTLIDPDKSGPLEADRIAGQAVECGSDAILVGGSMGVFPDNVDSVVKAAKRHGVPVILFPGSLANVSRNADAVLYMTPLNSEELYYHTTAKVHGALLALSHGLEPIPTAYIIVGEGGTAGFISRARPIPRHKPELIAAHVLAGAMMGSRIIYLEAGSGAEEPVPAEAVSMARAMLSSAGLDALLIAGGGIRTREEAARLARAGVDGIVTGTLVEESPGMLGEVIRGLREA